ncbi:unnamed protein product [Arabis nemorensis]|uniref:Uncharacterized protein n=1 Tax=Arabis nemorensis TaxID=586526 RepID=A0A565BJW7_9BRAS|nr:unnamed protein product [Arabis nemorensis]
MARDSSYHNLKYGDRDFFNQVVWQGWRRVTQVLEDGYMSFHQDKTQRHQGEEKTTRRTRPDHTASR